MASHTPCGYIGCKNMSTHSAYVYGKFHQDSESDSQVEDKYIPVTVCTFHAQHKDLWMVKEYEKSF